VAHAGLACEGVERAGYVSDQLDDRRELGLGHAVRRHGYEGPFKIEGADRLGGIEADAD
jgi:hypothetical protein